MNANFYPEMTKMLKKIIDDISEKIIKEGTPIILVDEYSWYREVLSLMAKQINLCDSCLLLLENGMEQEAYLLARSQFNNMLWIKYLCNDDTKNIRVKEYFYQPHINQILSCKNIKKMNYQDKMHYYLDCILLCIMREVNLSIQISAKQNYIVSLQLKNMALIRHLFLT